MNQFIACKLEFTCEAENRIRLPRYSGSAFRGAFFESLRRDFCMNKAMDSCLRCATAGVCPICRLVATVEKGSDRGAEIPRPFALQPVIGRNFIEPREDFSFGLTLYGRSLPLFPYVVLGVQRMGEAGIGSRAAPGYFRLKSARVINPLTGQEKNIYSSDARIVNMPDVTITHQDVLKTAAGMHSGSLRLKFLTPLRLVADGVLVQKLTFPVFMQRLLRRLTDLHRHYCISSISSSLPASAPAKPPAHAADDGKAGILQGAGKGKGTPLLPSPSKGEGQGEGDIALNKPDLDFPGLLERSREVSVIQDDTYWVDLSSYSRRRNARTPVGGLMGAIVFSGNIEDFLPLLVWGQFTHIGKDATRGNGWYSLSSLLPSGGEELKVRRV